MTEYHARIILLGKPGIGKGTQAARIAKQLQIPHISTGDKIRQYIGENPDDEEVKKAATSGKMVSDELVNKIAIEELHKDECKKGFVLDGYPRKISQAEFLEESGTKIDIVINLQADDEVVFNRATRRRVCENTQCRKRNYHLDFCPPKEDGKCDECEQQLIQRPDDLPETVKNRLKIYSQETQPLVEFYQERGLLAQVNGTAEIETVTKDILSALQK